MKVLGKLADIIIYLVYAVFWCLCALVLIVSLLTTVVFRQYEQNDLFDFVSENIPLLLFLMLVFFALMLAAQAAADRKETRLSRALSRGSAPEVPAKDAGSGNPMASERAESGSSAAGKGSGNVISSEGAASGTARAPFPWLLLLVAGAVSLFLVLTVRGLPTADASMLDDIIQQFLVGDYSGLTSGYLCNYPFQTFYVYVGEIIARLFGEYDNLAWQILNVIAIECEMFCFYRITWELFESRRVCLIMQILSCGAFCLYAFSTFIYLDIISMAVQTAAIYLQILYMKREKIGYEAAAGLLIAVAILMKMNCLIALIAMILFLIVDAIWKTIRDKEKEDEAEAGTLHAEKAGVFHAADAASGASACAGQDRNLSVAEEDPAGQPFDAESEDPAGQPSAAEAKKNPVGQSSSPEAQNPAGEGGMIQRRRLPRLVKALLLSAMLIAFTWTASELLELYTWLRTGQHIPEGFPTICYIAMGLQMTEGKCGWYNGSTISMWSQSGNDPAKATELALEAIRESFAEFRNSGRYTLNFFYQKFISQWGDSTCVSMRELENTYRHTQETAIASWLIFGMGGTIMQWIMNVFHSMIYLGNLFYAGAVLTERRRDCPWKESRKERGKEGWKESRMEHGKKLRRERRENSGEHCARPFKATEAMLVIFIFGGMLFHMIWEASGRYTMRYYLTMIPLAAWGWSLAADRVLGRIRTYKESRKG